MVTTTKTSNDSVKNNIDISLKTSKTSFSDKSISELYKTNNSKKSYENDDFKKVLNTKTNVKEQDHTRKVENDDDNSAKDAQVVSEANEGNKDNKVKDNNDIDGLKEKLEELEEKSKNASNDDAEGILNELLALLAKFGIKEEDLKTDGKINSEMLEKMLESIDNKKSSDNNLTSIMDKIMELLKNDSVKDKLDTGSLKVMEKLLNNLSSNLAKDNSEALKDLKSNLKHLMSEILNMLSNKQEQTNKVLSLEDMLNKNYSQDNSESSTEDGSSNTATSNGNKSVSKEDKFLNSLIEDKDDSSNKINLFASRATVIQNQGVNATVRGLTINKATFVDDLIKDVKFMSTNALKELTVKVNPGNLGEITIRLVQEDGMMRANLKADSKETTALLSQNLAEIKKQLTEQNIKVSEVNIELYQDDTTYFKDQGFEGQFAQEQNRQSNSSNHKVSNDKLMSSEDVDENLAEENNSLNFFA